MINCWVLTSVRCGSTFLCDMLNSSNLFSEPLLEYFHWTSKFVLSKTPLCCKVIRRHFLSKYSDEDKTKIEAEVPNLKYIWLRRHNNYERAISLYFSLKNRLWRTTKDSKKEYFKNYQEHKSTINIWDYVIGKPIVHRPYYHIQDRSIHQQLADYYYTEIIQHL